MKGKYSNAVLPPSVSPVVFVREYDGSLDLADCIPILDKFIALKDILVREYDTVHVFRISLDSRRLCYACPGRRAWSSGIDYWRKLIMNGKILSFSCIYFCVVWKGAYSLGLTALWHYLRCLLKTCSDPAASTPPIPRPPDHRVRSIPPAFLTLKTPFPQRTCRKYCIYICSSLP